MSTARRARCVRVVGLSALTVALTVVIILRTSNRDTDGRGTAQSLQVTGALYLAAFPDHHYDTPNFAPQHPDGSVCSGFVAYPDITAGATVAIKDMTGATLDVVSLDAGIVSNGGSQCVFPFEATVSDRGVYVVEVPLRGVWKLTKVDVEAGVSLRLGS